MYLPYCNLINTRTFFYISIISGGYVSQKCRNILCNPSSSPILGENPRIRLAERISGRLTIGSFSILGTRVTINLNPNILSNISTNLFMEHSVFGVPNLC